MTMRDKPIRPMPNQRPQRRGALGKGITSLLGDVEDVEDPMPSTTKSEDRGSQVLRIRVADIEPNPHQPRKIFNEKKLEELTQSLRVDGVLQPIMVTRSDVEGKYILVAGERRWRASQRAGLESIPALIKEGASEDLLRLALIENIQRDDLNVVEEAEAYQSLIKDYGLTQEQCAEKVGKDRSTVTNILRILNLPAEVQDDLLDARLTMGHARALLGLGEKRHILQARDIVVKKQMNVRQTEDFCKNFKSAKPGAAAKKISQDPDLDYIADTIRNSLKTKVRVSGNPSRGKIEISYFSAADLERIVETLNQG